MSESCTHDCASCGEPCASRENGAEDRREKGNDRSRVKKMIAVVSGKGGVGKSLVTSMLAVLVRRAGYRTAILDADVTGPSIPKAFGLKEKAKVEEGLFLPATTKSGISVMSLNLLLENDADPVIWRGPVIAGAVKQFWTDVAWGDVDYMFVDMPPGTGDVPLTVFQSLPLDGVIVVTTPQELVGMIVEKAVRMADMMKIPVLALVENMSYFECSECGHRHFIFGESHLDSAARQHGVGTVCRLPIDPAVAAAVDRGAVEEVKTQELDKLISVLTGEEKK